MMRLTLVVSLALFATRASSGASLEAWSGAADEWFRGVDRSETQLRTAVSRGCIEPADREAAIAQIRAGAASLRTLMQVTISSDSLLAGTLIAPPLSYRRPGPWGNRFIRATSIVAVSTNLVNMVAGWRGASNESRYVMSVVSGAVGGSGALVSMLMPRPKPPPPVDPNERARTVIREMLLRDTFAETRRQLDEMIEELGAIRTDPAQTDSEAVSLVRRYAGTLMRASAVLDIQVPHASTIARTGGTYPSFSEAARGRLSRLADHLDRVGAEWRTWRWLVGRSQRDALGFLALVERP